ncbi:hypothetical protein EYF80_002166 [Liparis tanakae]|uniref:Uncharacterized protein n=1 Tax=Liparis tanakae TaxID=230148 RepID=A0A4Z2JB60_9TELE|nr:hypothetical protein EYF80_002166 [Liparis tanakae]
MWRPEAAGQIVNTGKIKMKKALMPPITLMTSPMSGTNMAMRRVMVIQITLVLNHHQEGDTDHEEVEAETDFTELTHSSSTHLFHHVLIRLLSAD